LLAKPPHSAHTRRLSQAIVFSAPIPLAKVEEISAALTPLVKAGYTVAVVLPAEAADELGWRVMCNAPDRHASFRMPTHAKAADWGEAVSLILRPSR
jgi:hypothetical protein